MTIKDLALDMLWLFLIVLLLTMTIEIIIQSFKRVSKSKKDEIQDKLIETTIEEFRKSLEKQMQLPQDNETTKK